MIGQCDIRPPQFTVNDLSNGMSEVSFYDNITEEQILDMDQDKKIVYNFDMYEVWIPSRVNLTEDIQSNYQEWLTFAKGQTAKPLSDKEKLVELQTQINSQDTVMNELMFEIIPSIIGGV